MNNVYRATMTLLAMQVLAVWKLFTKDYYSKGQKLSFTDGRI